ncbi:MAG TPA: CBS domain-containing protein [Gemmatimonadales bacterium]|jgi:CBS domain-containing protein|nr:CBS domain-containing protein [Gemmatimonadales bacterium]
MKTKVSLKTVREIMAKPPETVAPDLTVGALLKLFDRHLADAFPVVNADGVLLGLVSRLDVLRLLRPDPDLRMPDWNTISRQRVDRIMRHGVISVEPGDPAFAAADLMVTTRFQTLPVVERSAGRPVLVGLVTRSGLLEALLPQGTRPMARF